MQNRLAAFLMLSCVTVGLTLATAAPPANAGEQPAKTADSSTAKPSRDAPAPGTPDCAAQVWPHFSSDCLRGGSAQVNVRQVNLTTASRP